MLSEKLNKHTIEHTHFDTRDIVNLFQEQELNGIEGMNLKLVIDLLEDVARLTSWKE